MSELGLGERRSCRIVGLSRSVAQYRPVARDDDPVIARMRVLVSEHRRYGCPCLHAMLRREGLVVNHKRMERFDRVEGLQVRTKKRRKLPRRDRVEAQLPQRPMQRWSLDFMSDQLATIAGSGSSISWTTTAAFVPGRLSICRSPGRASLGISTNWPGAAACCASSDPPFSSIQRRKIPARNGPKNGVRVNPLWHCAAGQTLIKAVYSV